MQFFQKGSIKWLLKTRILVSTTPKAQLWYILRWKILLINKNKSFKFFLQIIDSKIALKCECRSKSNVIFMIPWPQNQMTTQSSRTSKIQMTVFVTDHFLLLISDQKLTLVFVIKLNVAKLWWLSYLEFTFFYFVMVSRLIST